MGTNNQSSISRQETKIDGIIKELKGTLLIPVPNRECQVKGMSDCFFVLVHGNLFWGGFAWASICLPFLERTPPMTFAAAVIRLDEDSLDF